MPNLREIRSEKARRRKFTLLLGFALFVGGGCTESEGADGAAHTAAKRAPGALELAFVAADSGAATPVRVQILDADRKSYVAENAILVGGHCRDSEAPLARQQAAATLRREVPNAWTGTSQFYADGSARIIVPPGRYRVEVFKGFEYRVARRHYTVRPGETVSDSVPMRRWVDMPASGWFGSDGHLHIARTHRDDDLRLSSWMQAEDIHVANFLQWGSFRSFHNARQYAFGDEGVHQGERDHLLIAGQENPRIHFLGHIVVLGANEPARSAGSYFLTLPVFEEAHRLGGLAGYAHFAEAFGGQDGLSMDLPHEVVDFVEVVQVGQARYGVWYEALDAGFHIPPTAGTDYPCGEALPGAERFYTKVEGRLTRESWLEGIRRGRTFATNGPLLRFSVNGLEMGDVLRLREPQAVSIEAEVLFDRSRDDVTHLHLVQNGITVQTFARNGDSTHIRFSVMRPIEEASWLAIRATGRKLNAVGLRIELGVALPERPEPILAEAHSAPVFVDVDGMPLMRDAPRAKKILRKWMKRLDALEASLEPGHFGRPGLAGDVEQSAIRRSRPQLRAAIGQARARYVERLK
jgi:hypothetical protein